MKQRLTRTLAALALAVCFASPMRAAAEPYGLWGAVPDGSSICFNAPGQIVICSTVSGVFTFSGAITFSAAGTAVSVTNNATIGGTLGLTGNLSLGAAGQASAYTITALPTAFPETDQSNTNAATTSAHVLTGPSLPQPAATNAALGVLEVDIPSESATNAPPALYVKNGNAPVTNVTPGPAAFVVQGNAAQNVAAWYVNGTCTGANSAWQWFDASNNPLLKITCGGAVTAPNGDFTVTAGNLFMSSQTSGKGEIITSAATRFNTAAGVGDYIIGGGNLSSNTNGNCSADGCGGHVHQSVYFSAAVSSGTTVTCTAPIACRINSTSASAIATITLTFIQAFVEPPTGCVGTDESGTGTLKVSSFTGTPGTSITAVVFTVTGAGTGTQNFDVGCGIGNGP